jgi:hypothetical protein
MEEDDMISGKRRKLQLEKERLNGFSERLAKLVYKINQPDELGPERVLGVERDDSTIPESRWASNGSNESDTAMEESNEEAYAENTIMVDLEKKRRTSNTATVVQNPEI